MIVAMIVPLFLLMRTQRAVANEGKAAKDAQRQRELAAAEKKQAKLERGVGKKKKGPISRMKSTMTDGTFSAQALEIAHTAGGGGGGGTGTGTGTGTRRDQRKADKRAAKAEDREAATAQREAIKEREAANYDKRRIRDESQAENERAREAAEAEAKAAEEKKKQESDFETHSSRSHHQFVLCVPFSHNAHLPFCDRKSTISGRICLVWRRGAKRRRGARRMRVCL